MKKIVTERRKLIANFLANIGVAWFTAGVIGAFINETNTFFENLKTVAWGVLFSTIFLLFGTGIIMKKVK